MYITNQNPGRPGQFGEVIEALGLGVAVFQTGQSLLSSGDFTCESSTVNYIHERTPASQTFRSCSMEFSLKAFHPRPIIGHISGDQVFWFRLSFEYNGNDIRNAAIIALQNRSSWLPMSTFSVRFIGQAHSVPSAPVAEVMFQVAGRWNPAGRGDVTFSGNLRLRADGDVTLGITSERNWVWVGTQPAACARVAAARPPVPPRDVVMPLPYVLYFSPPGSDRLREGDQERFARWILGLAPAIRQSIARGQSPIRVEGFASTTQRGSANVDLSRRRAQRVAQLLRDLLGAGAQIDVRALGEYTAGTPDRVESERERRVQVTILFTTRLPGSP